MSVIPQSSIGRIALAIATSVALHGIILFTPMVELSPREVPLPPLMARLEPLPKLAPLPRPAPVKKKIHRAPTPPQTVAPKLEKIAAESDAPMPEINDAASAVEPVPEKPIEPVEPAKVEEPPPLHPLPKKARLAFAVYKGTDFRVGDARLNFEQDEQKYNIKVEANTTGIVSVFKKFDLSWTSHGTLNTHGLHPDKYSDTRSTGNGSEARSANFNWLDKTLIFSAGNSVALPEGSQDRVSFMFQMSQIPWNENLIALNISDGSKLDRYEIDIGAEETIDTHMGKIRALPFRKRHAAHESYLDIWLGVEYRLLPVKIRQTDKDGNIEYEMVITEIRVADE